MNCYITKARLWSLLNEDAMAFATWLISNTAASNAFKVIFDSIPDDFNLDDPLVKNTLFPLLVSQGVISATTQQRIADFCQANTGTFISEV